MQQTELQLLSERKTCDPDILGQLRRHIRPLQMDSTRASDYERLRDELAAVAREQRQALNHLFYLAIPPDIFLNVIDNLASVGLNRNYDTHTNRILVEKPFGNDLASAQQLIDHLSSRFDERQIFRIDHYLAKEMAQNILAFRFDNPLIEGVWSREFIDHIQITMAEDIGIQGRVHFYESMGALRDIVQNHLMQILTLVTMEYPVGMSTSAIHREKLRLLNSIERISPAHIDEVAVRGQYDTYAEEVARPETANETYVALRLSIANTRWGGVPILLRTGKALATGVTEICLVFKDRLHRVEKDNILIMTISPNEGISLNLMAKRPGFSKRLQTVDMNFYYSDSFHGAQPDPYQRVLMDAMRGDQSLFASSEEILASWTLLQPVVDAWRAGGKPVIYESGSWGPAKADALARDYGFAWHNPDPQPPSQE